MRGQECLGSMTLLNLLARNAALECTGARALQKRTQEKDLHRKGREECAEDIFADKSVRATRV